jgi:signal transduction histidine kinase
VNHEWGIPLCAAIAETIIGAMVLRGGLRDPLRRTFAAMTMAIASWNLTLFGLAYFDDPHVAELWSRVFRVGICLAPATTFHFTLELSGTRGQRWLQVRRAAYAIGILLAIADLAGLLVNRVVEHRFGWYPEPTRLYGGITISVVAFLLLSANRFWHAWRHPESPRQRVQARLFALGAAVQIPATMTNFLPLYGIDTLPLGSVGTIPFFLLQAYGIARHRLMDVDFVVRKLVSFLLAATIALAPWSIAVAVFGEMMGFGVPFVVGAATIIVGLVSAVVIPLLQQALETHVQRAIFPHRYDYRLHLRTLAADLVHLLDERELVRRLGSSLVDELELEGCEVYLRDERGRHLIKRYPASEAGDELDPAIAASLESLVEPMLTVELDARRPVAAAAFRARGWEVGMPLRVNDRLTGLVALRRNRDLRIVSGEDLNILASVASAASVALENTRLSRELRRSETALERANRLSSIGTLAAGIAHEIRNPLTAVKTFLDLLPQRLDDRDFVSSFRELSLSELRRVTDLINDILAFGKSTSTERRAVELGPSLDQVVRLLDSTARKRQVGLELRVAPKAPAAWADPDQVKQIVLNLALNAIEASPAGAQVTLEVASAPHGQVAFEVRDHGAGIPADQLESIFHPFFTTKEQGTGLGLSLVHQMVVEHGGDITVDSEVGKGTTFRVTLPGAETSLQRTGT